MISGATIGYTYALGENYSSADIIRAVRSSLEPWRKRELVVNTVSYGPQDGLPNGVIEELSYACFDELWVDNAKAHLSEAFRSFVERTVGAVTVFPPSYAPNARPYVEGFFHILEEAGLHQLIGTSGSNPKDKRHMLRLPTDRCMTLQMLEDVVDLLIARINGSPGPNSSISRLEVMRRAVMRRTVIVRRIPENIRQEVLKFDMFIEKTISKDHDRLCVRYAGARYHSKVLSAHALLLRKPIMLGVCTEDLRTVECFLMDGTSIGLLKVEKRWRRTKHSLKTREEIIRMQNNGEKLLGHDVVRAYRESCETEALRSRRATTKVARMQKEQASEDQDDTVYGHANNSAFAKEAPIAPVNPPDYDDVERRLININVQYRK
ncbi:hypothetical protein ACFQUU_27925 [Herbaspirillum sp. GCM10030257]|uniref:hypothetical protein n=1 Tax=Herbaspirillum sp. GCM10030257 TaxID=3273393 RepID=UPI00360D1655